MIYPCVFYVKSYFEVKLLTTGWQYVVKWNYKLEKEI